MFYLLSLALNSPSARGQRSTAIGASSPYRRAAQRGDFVDRHHFFILARGQRSPSADLPLTADFQFIEFTLFTAAAISAS
jgi:hypothetical protein